MDTHDDENGEGLKNMAPSKGPVYWAGTRLELRHGAQSQARGTLKQGVAQPPLKRLVAVLGPHQMEASRGWSSAREAAQMEEDWPGGHEPVAAATSWVVGGAMYRKVVSGRVTSLRILAHGVVSAAISAGRCAHLRVLRMELAAVGPEPDLASGRLADDVISPLEVVS